MRQMLAGYRRIFRDRPFISFIVAFTLNQVCAALIWVLLMSNLMAVLLQTLSARLGIVTGHDLAQPALRAKPIKNEHGQEKRSIVPDSASEGEGQAAVAGRPGRFEDDPGQ